MSESLLDFDTWPTGIASARIPANNNARRSEVLAGSVISATTTAQPGSPAELDIYIIPAGATGSMWSSFDEDDVVIFYEATWTAFAPYEGLRKFVMDEGTDWQYIGDSSDGWVPAGIGPVPVAADIDYDNSISGLTATEVQAAIDELAAATGGVSSVNGDTGVVIVLVPIGIACSDETTALTAGTAKVTFRMPSAYTLTAVRASLTTPQATNGAGGIFTVDINEAGVSILSTKITIDNTEKTSTTATTPAVLSDANLADDAEITIDIDQIGDGTAKGLKVWLIGYPS